MIYKNNIEIREGMSQRGQRLLTVIGEVWRLF